MIAIGDGNVKPIFVAAMKHRSLYMCPRLKKHFSKKR